MIITNQCKQINTELLFIRNDKRRHQCMGMTTFRALETLYGHNDTYATDNKTARIKTMMSEQSFFTTIGTAGISEWEINCFIGI